MPSWLIPVLKVAISIGSPYLLELIKKLIAKLPAEVVEIINDLINGIKSPTIDTRQARAEAKARFKRHCDGVGCSPETK